MPAAQSVNPNLPVGGEDKVVRMDSSLTSFDEVERATTQGLRARAKAAEKKPEPKAKVEGEEKEAEFPEADITPDAKAKPAEKDADPKTAKSKADEKEETPAAADAKFKVLKAQVDGKEVDLRADAVLTVKVDGKPTQVKLRDLVDQHSGKVQYNKKFGELDAERKKFQSERQELQGAVNKLTDLSGKDPRAAVEYLCDLLGTNPREFEQTLRKQIVGHFEEWSKLSEDERKARETADETEFHKRRADRLQAQSAEAAQRAGLEKRIKAVQDKHKMDDAAFERAYSELVAWKAQGQFKEDITPELVGAVHEEMATHRDVTAMVAELHVEADRKDEAVKELIALKRKDPSLTTAQVKAIALNVYGSDAARKLARKVERSGSPAPTQPAGGKAKNKPDVMLDWDDV